MNGSAVRDRVFKVVILAFLISSILIQITVSLWFHEKLKNLESRLSLYPVNKPVEVDLRVTIPELAQIDGKIDRLTQEVGQVLSSRRVRTIQKGRAVAETSSKSDKKKAKPSGSTQVDVVEKIVN